MVPVIVIVTVIALIVEPAIVIRRTIALVLIVSIGHWHNS